VGERRDADVERVQPLPVEHVGVAPVGAPAGAGGEPASAVVGRVGHRDDPDVVEPEQRRQVAVGDVAGADEPDPGTTHPTSSNAPGSRADAACLPRHRAR
jgi:hypothetical protein